MKWMQNELEKQEKFISYQTQIKNEEGPIAISGLCDVAKVMYAIATVGVQDRPICIVTYHELQARKLYEDCQSLTKGVVFFPKKELVTYDYVAESKELPYQRMDALNQITSGKAKVIITTIEAVMQSLPTKEVIYHNQMLFCVGTSCSFEEVKSKLRYLGYEREELTTARGQFSSRGGIIDIGIAEEKGVRIEFWGDEVDSIRSFSYSSQRSNKMLDQVIILPAQEYVLEKSIEKVIAQIKDRRGDLSEKQKGKIEEDLEYIREGDYTSKIDKYWNAFYSEQSNILEYLSKDTLLFFDEVTKVNRRIEHIKEDTVEVIRLLAEKEKLLPDAISNLLQREKIVGNIANLKTIFLEEQDLQLKIQANRFFFHTREVHFHRSMVQTFFEALAEQKEKKKMVVLVSNKEKAEKLQTLFQEKQIRYQYMENIEQQQVLPGQIILTLGELSSGMEDYDSHLLLIDANELIEGEKKKKKITSSQFKEGEKVVFADLKIGDYVVHKTHGIGQFMGVKTITADQITKDYIQIQYKGEDVLYIPTNQLDSIRKYIGGGERAPKVNKLGSKEWDNTKAKVKRNLREVARELIELYAKRQKMRGFAFSKDTPWQAEFEDRFPYAETEDQLRCIEEVKRDMETPKPMDRLLCGDVGYGKTEVAIRAAFKAVMDQKQVAYLVPTTVLADQQYQAFKERMEEFPIRVEVLNRFRSKKEQEQIIRKLKLGEVDVVIGTHRILSKDVEFKDLGLLIIDEEHRFGVKDKEKVKEYKTNVDVLTMTATPIPRTLHMSIVGVRDMSVIYEPPKNRKPVQTYVLEYDEEVAKEAILKELERGGQVFYLFNHVGKIEAKANQIKHLLPEAKIGYAHGKMTGTQLENIMIDFIQGEINVLICTTILESGIDIPNANTIIVEQADRLGLAQLYQIRGRVGRADKQAYAYITYKRDKLLTEVADKRLKAMKEFTEFGSGFKIAMRDLEIRGAGSLLGEVQHGHMEQVGYDTYCHLLEEVMKEMQGEQIEEELDVQIDLNVSSYIPDEYISQNSQKIEVYQDIALARNQEEITNVTDEIIDRYGNLPEELENLLQIAQIKSLAKAVGAIKILQKPKGIVFTFDPNRFAMEMVDVLLKNYRNKIKFSPGSTPYVTYLTQSISDSIILKEVMCFLETLVNKRKGE